MKTSDAVSRAIATGSVDDLVRELGYPLDPVDIDLSDWARCGLDLDLDGTIVRRVSVVAHLQLFAIEARGEPAGLPRRFIDGLSKINNLIKYIVFYVDIYKNKISVHSRVDRTHRRLDLEPHRPTSEVLERLRLLTIEPEDHPSKMVARIDAALDRNGVTAEFFGRFQQAVADLNGFLGARLASEPESEIADESLLILSRMLFLRFVQEKGWLDRDRDYLANRLGSAEREGKRFFDDVLRVLFFGCLNTPWSRRRPRARDLGEIPYLNGGLFEPSPVERRHRRFDLPNDLFGRILHEVFDRFPFSLREDDDEGIHVDPEMLGRVFESLMESGERAKSGSFYTPREIVDVVTRRAIAVAIANRDRDLARQLEVLMNGGEVAFDSGQADEIRARARSLTILDPACGSGAFLLSALSVLERLERAMAADLDEPAPPGLRREIVERNLHGVDIKGAAVRLCELRLWLAIVSDPSEEDSKDLRSIRPLPNLDRNVLQGNSLLGPLDFLGDGRMELYREWSRGLRRRRALIERYRHAAPNERGRLNRSLRASDRQLASALLFRSIARDREEMRSIEDDAITMFGSRGQPVTAIEKIESRIRQLERRVDAVGRGDLDFFAYEVHFANALERGGFDVVLGNPPWVRSSRIDQATRRLIADRYRSFGHRGFDQTDLSVAFVERALGLAREGGVVAMVVPGKLASSFYGGRLREMITSSNDLIAVDDWRGSGSRAFGADVFPIGLTVRKGRHTTAGIEVHSQAGRFETTLDQLSDSSPVGSWCLAPPRVTKILRRLQRGEGCLHDVLGRRPVMGVKTGSNRSFFLGELIFSRDGVAIDESTGGILPRRALARCVRGRDVRRWKASASTWMLWPPPNGWADESGEISEWARRAGLEVEGLRLEWVRPEHLGIKVVWKDLSRGVQAVVLPESVEVAGTSFPLVPNQTLYVLDASSMDEAYLISAVLNSTVIDALTLALADPAKDSHCRYFGKMMGLLPWPRIRMGTPRANRLVRLARRAHQGERTQGDIDGEVSAELGLRDADLDVLREFVARRLRTD